ncbi:MAG: hypothetical protein ABJD07_03320 [Gemmatimonadaceae bacterium]
MKGRVSSFVAIAAIVLAAACGGLTNITASFASADAELKLYALNGTPRDFPSALITITRQTARAESGASYDVVFDITAAGQPVLYPVNDVSLVGSAGIRKETVAYSELLLAPPTNYNDSLPTPIAAGDVLVIRAQSVGCVGLRSPYVFSKMHVDSINVVTRTMNFHMRVDPNCGFRSFADGIPRE